jgi:hypothetical protein
MNQAQRRLLVSRIISGNLRYQNRLIFVPALDYEAECIYGDTLNDAIFQGCLTNSELVSTPISFDTEIKSILEKISDQKLKLYHARNSPPEQKKVKKALADFRDKIDLLNTLQFKNFNYSAEFVAEFAKLSFMVEKYNGPGVNMPGFFLHYNENAIDEETIRDVAQCEEWKEIHASKLYDFKGTREQIALINWTDRYDNILQHPEKPEDAVIEDHDMLDGWMIYLSRKAKRSDRKIKDGQEIYIPVPPDQVSEVQEMNSPEAKIIIARRNKALQQKGQLKETELPDVKQQIRMELNRR